MPVRTLHQGETLAGFDPGAALCDTDFVDCTFENCRWDGVRMRNCSFSGCRFRHCQLAGVVFSFCRMRDADFDGCAIRGVAWGGLQGRSAVGRIFARLHRCVLRYNEFSGMGLAGFDFSDCEMLECVFDDCKLTGANFRGAPLGRTAFTRCDLQKADFRDAQGYAIDPAANKMKGARFSFPDVVALLDASGIRIE